MNTMKTTERTDMPQELRPPVNNLKETKILIRRLRVQQKQLRSEQLRMDLRQWPGWTVLLRTLGIALILLLFLYSGPLLRRLDPSAAVLDAGLISLLLFTILALLLFAAAAWLLLRVVAPPVARYRNELYGRIYSNLSPCQKICIYAGSYLGFLFAFVGVFTAVL